MKVEKRTKFQIYFDILAILCDESKRNNKLVLTKVAHTANLPYDRFQNCLSQLIQNGMISRTEGEKLLVTDKGLEYVGEYKKITDFLKRMGLLP